METHTPPPAPPLSYQLIIVGHLDLAWSDWFDGSVIAQLADGTTSLTVAPAARWAIRSARLAKSRRIALGIPQLLGAGLPLLRCAIMHTDFTCSANPSIVVCWTLDPPPSVVAEIFLFFNYEIR